MKKNIKRKFNKFKFLKNISLVICIVLISIITKSLYISYICKSDSKALEYHAKNNDKFNIKKLKSRETLFSSEDLMIYKIDTITKNSFEFDESYLVKLKRDSNTWKLNDISLYVDNKS